MRTRVIWAKKSRGTTPSGDDPPRRVLRVWRSDVRHHVPLLPSGSWRSWRAAALRDPEHLEVSSGGSVIQARAEVGSRERESGARIVAGIPRESGCRHAVARLVLALLVLGFLVETPQIIRLSNFGAQQEQECRVVHPEHDANDGGDGTGVQ